jgi:hypothetical protein
MSTEVTKTENTIDKAMISKLVLEGDLAKMSADQKTDYYGKLCQAMGLNPFTQPFKLLSLGGKQMMYATKDCTEQLRKIHGVSITDVKTENVSGVFVVTVKAQDSTGRTDSATGAVTIENLKGDNLANALMKAETKAKRRVTLSICGLGMLDETEIETIPGAQPVQEVNHETEDKAPDTMIAFIESLVHTSTIEEYKKEKIEREMCDYSKARAEKCIAFLKEHQQEDFNAQLDRHILNSES